jgi:hypothetical protein
MTKISLLTVVASRTNHIEGMPDTNQFELLFDSLQKQDLKDFEVVLSDGKYLERKSMIARMSKKYSFIIKHIPQSPNFYYDNGYYAISNALNKALIWADGEIGMVVGDGFQFYQSDSLSKYWKWYKEGFLAMGMFYYFNKDGQLWPKQKEFYRKRVKWSTRDSRFYYIEKYAHGNSYLKHKWGTIFYGLSAFPIETAIKKLNGFNELCDGDHGVEDNEFGIRLWNIDKNNTNFVLDANLNIGIYISEDARDYMKMLNCKSNHSFCMLALQKNKIRANHERISNEDLHWCMTKSPLNIDYENWKPSKREFEIWLERQNVFDLEKLWKERKERTEKSR